MAKIDAYAIHEINRPIPDAVKQEGQPTPLEIIAAGRVFEATTDEMDSYERLGAARPASKAEVAEEEQRVKFEGSGISRPTLYRSVGPGSGQLAAATVEPPKKADTTPKKTGSAL